MINKGIIIVNLDQVVLFSVKSSIFMWFMCFASQGGASDSITDSSVLSNPPDSQNVSYLGLCGRAICPISYASYGLGIINPQLSVSI